MIKHSLKYLYEAEMTVKKITKIGKNFREGGGNFFWLAKIYNPGSVCEAASTVYFILTRVLPFVRYNCNRLYIYRIVVNPMYILQALKYVNVFQFEHIVPK